MKYITPIILTFLLLLFHSCALVEDVFVSCDEESALWGKAQTRTSPEVESCNFLDFDYISQGTVINGVSLSSIVGKTGDGPKDLWLVFALNIEGDIRDYEFKNPLRLSLDPNSSSNGYIKTDNPEIVAAFESGFQSPQFESIDIEIRQKRRDKENYEGHIKCKGTYFKGYNLDGSSDMQPFSYDFKFDTVNN